MGSQRSSSHTTAPCSEAAAGLGEYYSHPDLKSALHSLGRPLPASGCDAGMSEAPREDEPTAMATPRVLIFDVDRPSVYPEDGITLLERLANLDRPTTARSARSS
jgi:hypothetical protein